MTDLNESTIRLMALVPYPPDTTPSQRFRIEQWIPYLRSQKIEVDLMPFLDEELTHRLPELGHRARKFVGLSAAFLRRFRDVAATRRYNAVFVHRGISIVGPAMFERLVAWIGRPVIYDFDDAIFLTHTTEANRRLGWLKFAGKTATICRLSTHIVVGNSFLRDYARAYNTRVTVIPTSIDIDRFQPAARNGRNGRLIVGWTGSSTSQTHFEQFAPVLREVARHRDIEVRVVSNRQPAIADFEYTWRPWTPETEVDEISQLDIGVMPMPDDDWSRGKCALKALQYMALGIPTVASAVGANSEVITHRDNGMLATTTEDWITNLVALVDDGELRKRLGRAGRKTVETQYSTEHCAKLFEQVLRGTL